MTTITDVLYRPDGQTFRGSLTVTMPMSQPLYTSGGRTLTQLHKSIAVTDGSISLELEPNEEITPAGTSYTVRYTPSAGTPYIEYWVVPASGSPVTIADCRVSTKPNTPVQVQMTSFPPATSSSPGVEGTITYDANYGYVCVAPNVWKRFPFLAF